MLARRAPYTIVLALLLAPGGLRGEEMPAADAHGDPLPAGVRHRLGTVRFRHGRPANAVAYAPDSRTVASAGSDTVIRLWQADTGKEVRSFVGHENEVLGLAFSADGKRLASAAKDNGARVWDVTSGKELLHVKDDWPGNGNSFHAVSVAFAPDGKTLALTGINGWIGIWDAETGQRVRLLASPQSRDDNVILEFTGSVAFTPDGKRLVAGGRAGRVYDVASGKKLHQFPAYDYGVRVALAPDGSAVATKGFGPLIQVWDMTTGKRLRQWRGNDLGPGLAFASDNKTVAESGYDGLYFWDSATGKKARERIEHRGGVNCLAFAPDGKTVAGGGGDHGLHVWNLASGKTLGPAADADDPIGAVAFSPRSQKLAFVRNLDVYLASLGKNEPPRYLLKLEDSGHSLAFSPDERRLAIGCDNGTVLLWDIAANKERLQLVDHDERVVALQFTPDGKTLLGVDRDLGVIVWDTANGAIRGRLSDDKDEGIRIGGEIKTTPVAPSPDGKMVAYGGNDEGVHLFDALTGKRMRVLKAERGEDEERRGPVSFLAFSPDGALLATTTRDEKVTVWSVATGKPLRRWSMEAEQPGLGDNFSHHFMPHLAFSPDGRTLATWHQDYSPRYSSWFVTPRRTDGPVRLWEVATAKERATLKGHRGAISGLVFAADGRSLVTGSEDTTLLVWDLPGASSGKKPTPEEVKSLHADLSGDNSAKAYLALSRLGADPAEALTLLAEKLSPIAPVEAKRLAQLIVDLDSDKFAARKAAADELEKLGDQAAPALREVLTAKPSPDLRQRVEQLLARVDKDRHALTPAQLQALRALELLERIATPEARQLLEKLSRGAPAAWLTVEAKAAHDRLAQRAAP